MEFLVLCALILLLIYGYFYNHKLAKKYNRNSKVWIFYYLLIGPFSIVILMLIGKKSKNNNSY